jgi:hypothetical protein
MQLSFLGNTYDASFPIIEASETQETARFLGKQYAKKQFNVTQRQQSPATMIYRGVRYIR